MKKPVILLLLAFISATAFTQEGEKATGGIPAVVVKTLDGRDFNTSKIENQGNPIILSFFALWCTPCMRELSAIAEVYDDWVKETGVKVIAISVDDARSTSRVLPTVRGKNWTFDVLLDPNSDFKRAMNVNIIPHNFLLNADRVIVWQHTSFSEGSQHQLLELVKKVKNGEDISRH
ncbi:MAG: TlpA disulfide reductase family protein [Bacteroidales bacterium]|nr:TlpA disulfide reductase family protein [Bacteroidales bacterium]MDZ4204250.1 TlpA disulfide reductase family protein [Bacteroidales bacterium]